MQASEAVISRQAGPKKAPSAHVTGLIWSKFQLYGTAVLITLIVLTLLFVFFVAVPTVLKHQIASPVFPDQAQLNYAILLIHVATAIPPLALGMFAFAKGIRNASLRAHRWIGTIYCVTIWISAITGILLALANQNGVLAKMGFGCLGVAWFSTTYLAYKTGRAKNIVSHRRWMIRSYAVTLAVVSIRPMFLLPPPLGLDFSIWYVMATWLCWVPNLILAETYIRLTRPNGRLKYA